MLAAPELVVAELVEVLGEIEIPAELQHRMLADGVMRGQKCAEADAGHGSRSPDEFRVCCCAREVTCGALPTQCVSVARTADGPAFPEWLCFEKAAGLTFRYADPLEVMAGMARNRPINDEASAS
jgi:hypothetical protein